MKKTLLTLLFFPLIGLGQDKSFELGILFGGSLNSLKGAHLFPEKTLQPTGGFLAQYNFNNRFSIKSKLLYHIKGGRITTDVGEYDSRLALHYVTLPLLAQLNFGKNKWKFFGNTGVYLGYLINGEELIAIVSYPLESFNKLDFGLMLGYGASFQISERIKIFLESSFDYGLVNTTLTGTMTISALTQAMPGVVGLTYSFPKKKKTFNGTSTLKCADYDESLEAKQKKKTKWRLVLYKDGNKVGGKSKKGKSRLFKKKD